MSIEVLGMMGAYIFIYGIECTNDVEVSILDSYNCGHLFAIDFCSPYSCRPFPSNIPSPQEAQQ